MSSLIVFLLEILLNIGPKWRPLKKTRWGRKTGRTNLLPSKYLYSKILTICVQKFTILSRSAHFVSYIDLRAPTNEPGRGNDTLNLIISITPDKINSMCAIPGVGLYQIITVPLIVGRDRYFTNQTRSDFKSLAKSLCSKRPGGTALVKSF